MVKNPPCNAKDDKGSIPGVGTNIPHAPEQGSPQVTAKIPGASTNTQCSQINKYFKTEKDIEHLAGAVKKRITNAKKTITNPNRNYSLRPGAQPMGNTLAVFPNSPLPSKGLLFKTTTPDFPLFLYKAIPHHGLLVLSMVFCYCLPVLYCNSLINPFCW